MARNRAKGLPGEQVAKARPQSSPQVLGRGLARAELLQHLVELLRGFTVARLQPVERRRVEEREGLRYVDPLPAAEERANVEVFAEGLPYAREVPVVQTDRRVVHPREQVAGIPSVVLAYDVLRGRFLPGRLERGSQPVEEHRIGLALDPSAQL